WPLYLCWPCDRWRLRNPVLGVAGWHDPLLAVSGRISLRIHAAGRSGNRSEEAMVGRTGVRMSDVGWTVLGAAIVLMLTLVLVVTTFADDRCGFPPGTRIGCRPPLICACDESGCKWLWLDCER